MLVDTAPFSIPFVEIGYESIQRQLARVGVEVSVSYAWLLALPTMPINDPEGRLIIDDSGTHIVYPNGANGSNLALPQLPVDLVVPLKLWERQTNTVNNPGLMVHPPGGLRTMSQQTFLVDWEWVGDKLEFRGALQSQDVKIKYEKQLAPIVSVNDPVPIRGVLNAAAYETAAAFANSRGSALAAGMDKVGQSEIFALQQLSVRQRQRGHHRRQPYGRNNGRNYPIL